MTSCFLMKEQKVFFCLNLTLSLFPLTHPRVNALNIIDLFVLSTVYSRPCMATASDTIYVGRRTILPPPAPGTSSDLNAPPLINARTSGASEKQTPTSRKPRTRASAKQTPTPRKSRASASVPSNRAPAGTKPKNDPNVARVFSADVHERRVSPFFICL